MPPRKHDSLGNPFKLGMVYLYSFHKLELLEIYEDGRSGMFRLVESYGSLSKGWTGELHFDSMFEPLWMSKTLNTNKGAVMFLSKEW
jgi:hypothetical protein